MKKLLALVVLMAMLFSVAGVPALADAIDDMGPVTIQLSYKGSASEVALREKMGQMYMDKHPNVTIEWITLGSNIAQKLMVLASGNELPDVIYLNEDVLSFASRNILYPMNDLIARDNFDTSVFYKELLDVCTLDGKVYALPQEVSPYVVYYNIDMFEAAGVPLPTDDWTLDEFYAACAALTDAEKGIYGIRMPINWSDRQLNYFARFDAPVFTEDGKEVAFNNEKGLAALKFLNKMVVEDKVATSPADAIAIGSSFGSMFRNQQIAMEESGLWSLPGFLSTPLEFRWDVVMAPKGAKQASKAGVLNWAISADSEHVDLAWDIIKFFTSTEGMCEIASACMALPGSADETANAIIAQQEIPGNIEAFVKMASLLDLSDQRTTKKTETLNEFNILVEQMLNGDLTPEDTLAQMTENMNAVLAED